MVVVFDLDDTLYDEIDFLKSGFSEVANYLKDSNYYDFMLREFYQNGSGAIFDRLIEEFGLDISAQKLIEIYRFHKPNITLSNETKELLNFAKKYKTALISDSHYITQQNKFEALGLGEYIDYAILYRLLSYKKARVKSL